MTCNHWLLKLAAWTHDPAEKALVLLRDKAGHEGGTVKALQQQIFGQSGIPGNLIPFVKKADHWASAADRPSFPKDKKSNRYQTWAQVDFQNQPVLIHPLSGEKRDLKKIDINAEAIKTVSFDHFKALLEYDEKQQLDAKKTALAFWRFGAELDSKELGKLWQLLPADTRVPDHTIWNHLDLTSAFASSMIESKDGEPALLTMSFGPVQDFIAQARSTSDLWAGSHLLSTMVWQGLKVICNECGPDAVIFPQLRNVAVVDTWLQNEIELNRELFKREEWRTSKTDTNPLFSAALPNKFTAIVPASKAAELAEKVTQIVRNWVLTTGKEMLKKILETAGIENSRDDYCWQQLSEQLQEFPEVHWAAVPWSIISTDNGKVTANQVELTSIQSTFLPENESFSDSIVWKVLCKDIAIDGVSFWQSNPGALYPALFEILERLAASAKVARPFKSLDQQGYRCTLTGEYEWLTTVKEQLTWKPAIRKNKTTLWNSLAEQNKFGIKQGEHLGAIAMLKRLWPTHFTQWVEAQTNISVNRYVVSTHTMALAPVLQKLAAGHKLNNTALCEGAKKANAVVLPRKLAIDLQKQSEEAFAIAKGLPTLFDLARTGTESQHEALLQQLESQIRAFNNGTKPETYYAMLYMDGDKMGAWLADSWSDEEKKKNCLSYLETWHPSLREKVGSRFDSQKLKSYLHSYRAVSPARHIAISSALNSFALHIARHIVEDCYMGKLLYAGGDDVMAMLPVNDLLPCMLTLRLAYSGVWPKPEQQTEQTKQLLSMDELQFGHGHVLLKDKLLRVMGNKATASIGAVVAHHMAPLAVVTRELRSAEKNAKNTGRDAFALRVIKRGGGAESLNLPWLHSTQGWNGYLDADKQVEGMPELESTTIGRLMSLSQMLSKNGELSRRFAYIVNTWLPQLPDQPTDGCTTEYKEMLQKLIAYQLTRQNGSSPTDGTMHDFSRFLVELAAANNTVELKQNLRNIFAVAEFFSRESRGVVK